MNRKIVASLVGLACAPSALAADPKVPPAQDPGLAPLALVGQGIDYTDTAIAPRLARDGEGNIVGWDFVDNDIFPFSKDAVSNAQAKLLLSHAGIALVPVRVGATDYRGVGGAASFVSHTPIRTVVVTITSARKEDWDVFAQAAKHFGKLLFVVPSGDAELAFPAALNLPNVLSVAAPAQGTAKPETTASVTLSGSQAATAVDAAIVIGASLVSCHAAIVGEGDGAARKSAVVTKVAKRSEGTNPSAVPACP